MVSEYFRDLTGRVQGENIIPTSTETHFPEYPECLVVEINAVYENEVEVVDRMSSDSEDLDEDVRMLVGWGNWSNIVVGERRITHRHGREEGGRGDTVRGDIQLMPRCNRVGGWPVVSWQ